MKNTKPHTRPPYGKVRRKYGQPSVKKRIEALFLDNVGKILSRKQILQAAKDPTTRAEPENWHQRLSELRTDDGYTILSWRNRGDLKVQEYLMPHTTKRQHAGRRVRPSDNTFEGVNSCNLKSHQFPFFSSFAHLSLCAIILLNASLSQ
jgi:hypothetical protein